MTPAEQIYEQATNPRFFTLPRSEYRPELRQIVRDYRAGFPGCIDRLIALRAPRAARIAALRRMSGVTFKVGKITATVGIS